MKDFLSNEIDARVQCFLGEKLLEKSQFTDAIEVLEKALEGLNDNPD